MPDENLGVFEQNPCNFILIMSIFLPINIGSLHLIVELIEKARFQKKYGQKNSVFFLNHSNWITSLTQINQAFLTKSSLIDVSSVKINGAIIKENYYAIDEVKLHNLKIKQQPMEFSSSPQKETHNGFKLQLEKIEIKQESSHFFIQNSFKINEKRKRRR